MKNIVIFSVLLLSILQINSLKAQDDVYDAPKPKQAKVKQTYTAPAEQQEKIIPVEKTMPYDEGNSSTSRVQSKNYDNNNYSQNQNYNQSNNYSSDNSYSGSDFGYGYTDRISRFHNSSFQFNYGMNNWNSNFYDPYNSYSSNYGWNNWDNYSFTPSWTYGYNNFYNPFCGNSQMIIIQPGFGYSSWYNTGYYNPYNNWNNYGFSPYCTSSIYTYGYSNYEGYYDNNKKNVVYTPRTGGYSNTNHPFSNGSNNTNNYNSSNTNTSGYSNSSSNTQTPTKKWNNNYNNNNSNTSNNNNTYRYNNNNQQQNNNSYNNNSNQPSNNNGWGNSNHNSGTGNSGIKTGSRPK